MHGLAEGFGKEKSLIQITQVIFYELLLLLAESVLAALFLRLPFLPCCV